MTYLTCFGLFLQASIYLIINGACNCILLSSLQIQGEGMPVFDTRMTVTGAIVSLLGMKYRNEVWVASG